MPCADKPNRLAVQGTAQQTVEREVALAYAYIGAVRLAVNGLDQGDGELGYRLGRVRRYVRHEKSQLLGPVEIDVIEPHTPHQDSPDALSVQRLEHFGRQLVVNKGVERVRLAVREEGSRLGREYDIMVCKFDVQGRRRRQVLLVVGLGAKDGELHSSGDGSSSIIVQGKVT